MAGADLDAQIAEIRRELADLKRQDEVLARDHKTHTDRLQSVDQVSLTLALFFGRFADFSILVFRCF